MTRSLRIGISTCPNDTFTFHALMNGEVSVPGLELEFTLADVEELNEAMFAGRLDVAKVSFHAALENAKNIVVLPSGSALGFGVGPVLLGAPGRQHWRADQARRVLAPGRWTTASLLMRLFHPEVDELEHLVFSEIMAELAAGRADYGVCIHEGRFTWEAAGLSWIEDLGARFERETASALPLGGMVAQRRLSQDAQRSVALAIRASLQWARLHPDACLQSMRRFAQEETDDVLWQHVDLYVNEWTSELGDEGRAALNSLAELARQRGLLACGEALHVLEAP
ncbi:MAG: hypothetical protein CMJ89_17175 [Planctomycetes bacterium]|nr:hypothetical protein [Planctomycetota bacterium]